jgi:transcriptional regulator with XRE-family HTH domain
MLNFLDDSHLNYLLCKNIKNTLRIHGIKQEILASTLNMQQNHLSEKLNGKSTMKTSLLLKISLATNISVNELINIDQIERNLGLQNIKS